MPACGSPRLIAACHVFRRRMVPWHPPCALVSLIFSSLDPETNCCYFEVVLVGRSLFRRHYSVLQLAFILNHFLCSCQGAGSSLNCIQVLFPNPESDTDSNAISNSFRCDAVRLLTFLAGIQLAQQLCCHAISALLAALMDD